MEPLKLADGTLVFPSGRVVPSGDSSAQAASAAKESRQEGIVVIPTNREAQQLVVAARRKLADLPDVPRAMNSISVVLSYSLFGLDDNEIAVATGLAARQVAKIKQTEAYSSMHDDVVRNIIAAESGDIRDLFVKHARSAASTLVESLNAGKAADRIKAAGDILDRGGFRPNDVVEHRHKLEGGLTIEIIRKDDKPLPTIDIDMED